MPLSSRQSGQNGLFEEIRYQNDHHGSPIKLTSEKTDVPDLAAARHRPVLMHCFDYFLTFWCVPRSDHRQRRPEKVVGQHHRAGGSTYYKRSFHFMNLKLRHLAIQDLELLRGPLEPALKTAGWRSTERVNMECSSARNGHVKVLRGRLHV